MFEVKEDGNLESALDQKSSTEQPPTATVDGATGLLSCLRLRLLFAKMLFCALEVFAAFVMPSRSAQLKVNKKA